MWEARRRRYGSDSRSPSPVWYRSRSRSRERGYARDRRRTREKDRSFSRSRSRSRSRSSPRSRGGRDRSRSRERSDRHERRWVHDRFRQLEEEEQQQHHEHQRDYDADRSGRDRHDCSGGHMRNGRENSNSRYHRDSYYDDLYDDRYYGGRDAHPRSGRRLHRYSDDEYDDDWDRHRDRGRSPYRSRRREEPCSVIYLKGVPVDRDEGDLYKVFEGLQCSPKIESIRIMRDRITGQSRGFAFVDFASVDDAQKVMDGGFSVEIDGCRLHMEYSSAPLPAKPSSGSAHLDWVCNMCGAVNFARRLECYQCCAPRAKDAQRVSSDPDGPSCILKVSGLEQQTSEDSLYQLFAAHVPVKEIRMVLDKFTSAPRGFAFVHFHTVADASRMLNMFQGHVIAGQQLPLKVCFARDRLGGPLGKAANAAAAAVEAAHAMQQYSSWEPKEFDQEAVQVEKKEASEGPSSKGAGNNQDDSGYQYDPASGYYYHSATGFYFDANTGMYFDNHKQQWLMYDHETKEYAPYSDEKAERLARQNSVNESDGSGKVGQGVSTAAQNAVESTNAAVEVVKGEYAEKGKTVRRKGATIGAAAQLNPEGLLAAAKAEQVMEQKLLREVAAKRANVLKNRAAKQKNKKSGNKAPPPGNAPHVGSVTAALSRLSKRDGKVVNPGVEQQDAIEAESPVTKPTQVQPAKRVQGVIRGGRWTSGAPSATKPI